MRRPPKRYVLGSRTTAPQQRTTWSRAPGIRKNSRKSTTAASSRSRRSGRSRRTAIARSASAKGSATSLMRSARCALSLTFQTELSNETSASILSDSRSNSASCRRAYGTRRALFSRSLRSSSDTPPAITPTLRWARSAQSRMSPLSCRTNRDEGEVTTGRVNSMRPSRARVMETKGTTSASPRSSAAMRSAQASNTR